MAEARTLGAVVGENLRAWRARVGCTQDQLARRLTDHGLAWRQPTVAQVERGQREVSVVELLLLSAVTHLRPAEFLNGPEGDEVAIGERSIDLAPFRSVLAGESPGPFLDSLHDQLVGPEGVARDAYRRWSQAADDPGQIHAIAVEAAGDAEIKASRSLADLGLKSSDVAAITHAAWGHGLVAERDRRLGERVGGESLDQRSVQAHRGHITRELLAEIVEFVGARNQTGIDGVSSATVGKIERGAAESFRRSCIHCRNGKPGACPVRPYPGTVGT